MKTVSAAHEAGLRNYALRFEQPDRLDRARQTRHLDRDRLKDPTAATPAGQPCTASLGRSAVVVHDCREKVAVFRVPEHRLMTGILLTVCDPYALPGFHCPYDACLPISS
jgi:hypothetical protein